MYKTFWHQYLHDHAAHGGGAVSINPGALFAALVCLIVLMAWAAFQMQARCANCSAWPVRCRCSRERAKS